MSRVTNRNLVELVSKRADVSMAAARELLGHVFGAITDELARGSSVTVTGFGTWRMKVCPPRRSRDPRDGREVMVPPRTRVGFKAGAALRRSTETSIEPEIFFGEGVATATELDRVFGKLFGLDAGNLGRAEVEQRLREALGAGAEREAAEFFRALLEWSSQALGSEGVGEGAGDGVGVGDSGRNGAAPPSDDRAS